MSQNRAFFYYSEPNYKDAKILEIKEETKKKFIEKLSFLYGEDEALKWYPELERLLKVHYAYKTQDLIEIEKNFNPENRFTQKDAILITYGDIIEGKCKKPLEVLEYFCKKYWKDAFEAIHILPFFPYSSDKGFAVIDFEEVDSKLGDWEDIERLKETHKLMFDGVFNHISSKSKWFVERLNGNEDYKDFFIEFSTKQKIDPELLKIILRPRTTPLFHEFYTIEGPKLFWTTFSKDQIDLNYKNPKVLMKIIDILLFYVRKGADIIRIDAATYLWSELGTTSAHLKETHEIVKLFKLVFDTVVPTASIITETNVPHKDNISYFGNGYDEAQMVYNFALPPLVLYTFLKENSSYLTEWAKTIKNPSKQATFFNFLATHDGIGVLPAKGILTDEEIKWMSLKMLEHGGFISFKPESDGSYFPYELNITWWNAINNENEDESFDIQLKRFISSWGIALSLAGVPGIYLHGFLGSKSDLEAVLNEKHPRAINRMVINEELLENELNDKDSRVYKITSKLIDMLIKRKKQSAFHPNSKQKILDIDERCFAILRVSDENEAILAITNITKKSYNISIPFSKIGFSTDEMIDIISGKTLKTEYSINISFTPYETFWLKTKIIE